MSTAKDVPHAYMLDSGAEDSNFSAEKLISSGKTTPVPHTMSSNDWRIRSSPVSLAIKGRMLKVLRIGRAEPASFLSCQTLVRYGDIEEPCSIQKGPSGLILLLRSFPRIFNGGRKGFGAENMKLNI
jgi:hypothetical protein